MLGASGASAFVLLVAERFLVSALVLGMVSVVFLEGEVAWLLLSYNGGSSYCFLNGCDWFLLWFWVIVLVLLVWVLLEEGRLVFLVLVVSFCGIG